MRYIIIQKKDFKTIEFKRELKHLGITLFPVEGSPIRIPLIIISLFFKYGKPEAVIYRYLNDYKSFSKTIFRLLSEVLSIILIKLFSINLIWICHNVDRETDQNFSYITSIRRRIMARNSKEILVTDPLLEKHARKIFPLYEKKINSLTFGVYSTVLTEEKPSDFLKRLEKFVGYSNFKKKSTKYGFVAGSINSKTAQYNEIPRLMKEASSQNVEIRMIVVGPIGDFLRENNNKLYLEFVNNKDILFIDEFIYLDMKVVSRYIDFYWRVYLDLSTPATLYEASLYEKPILTQNKGFLGEAVSKYRLGFIVDEDYNNLGEIFRDMSKWDSNSARTFLESHTWEYGAKKIYDSIL